MSVLIPHQEHPCIEKWVEICYEAHCQNLVSCLQVCLQSPPVHEATGAASPGLTDSLVTLPVSIEAVLGAVDHSSAPGTLVRLVGEFNAAVTDDGVREELVQESAVQLVPPHLRADHTSDTILSVATADQSVVVEDWFVWESNVEEFTRVFLFGTEPGKALELNLILRFSASESSLASKAFCSVGKTGKYLQWVDP